MSHMVPEATTRVKLNIWHPRCWMLNTTSQANAGLIAYGVYVQNEDVYTYSTVYSDTKDGAAELINNVANSKLTDEVKELDRSYRFADDGISRPGNHSRGLLVRYRSQNSIYESMISKGFFPTEPIRVRNGREHWTVATINDRGDVGDVIDDIAEREGADIQIEKITSAESASPLNPRIQNLSERQREVFELAQNRDYYSWPRKVSAAELAEELEISKATFLEHLRKAEAKLLN